LCSLKLLSFYFNKGNLREINFCLLTLSNIDANTKFIFQLALAYAQTMVLNNKNKCSQNSGTEPANI